MLDLGQMTKQCSKCTLSKSLEAFSLHKGGLKGRSGACKQCKNESYRLAHAEKRALQVANFKAEEAVKLCKTCGIVKPFSEYYAPQEGHLMPRGKCMSCAKEAAASKYIARREYCKAKALEYATGWTAQAFEKALRDQQGLCAICKVKMTRTPHTNTSVNRDHCHETDSTREILCLSCNTGIGKLKDNPDICEAAARYLRKHLVKFKKAA